MALALCRHLETSYGLSPEIKWPNDVYVGGGKISGILVETEGEFYLAGMGLNLNRRVFPPDLRSPAIDLVQALSLSGEYSGPVPEASRELDAILAELDRGLADPPPISEVARRLAGLGQPVNVILGDPSRMQRVQGVAAGLNEDGALLLDTGEKELLPVYSGEIR
jgi:BirA family biotin operon repressor/biotin-[acetyl-CoA-carboxylase] ligase